MTGEPYYAYGHIKKATFKNSHQFFSRLICLTSACLQTTG